MSQCVAFINVGSKQLLSVDNVTPIDSCPFFLLSATDYTTLTGFNQLALDYFQFDSELFTYLVGSSLVLFITSFGVGKVLGTLRKV